MKKLFNTSLITCSTAAFSVLLSFGSPASELEVVTTSKYPMNGVAITENGRIFVSMPQWTGEASPSVGEVLPNGEVKPYPGNKWNEFSSKDSYNRFSNVNAVHTDEDGNLWVVDYAAPFWGEIIKGSQKLVKVNTTTNTIERVYRFDDEILPPHAKLNDVRVDLSRGVAYISEFGVGALIVVDLDSGKSRRLLNKHFSARAHPDVVTYFNGKPFSTSFLHLNDIELDSQKEHIYYQPTGGPVMYRIKTEHLTNVKLTERELSDYVEVYSKSLTIGGITVDENDKFYLGNVQDKAITIIDDGKIEGNLIKSERILWPDAMDIHNDHLYIPCPQLRLLPKFNDGQDKTIGDFTLYRYKLN